MSYKKWLVMSGATLLLSMSTAFAQGHGHAGGHDKDKHDNWEDRHQAKHEFKAARHEERHYYREHDRELHEWYVGHREHLPPGLAKRDRLPPGLERQLVVRGTLPPGLRGYMRPCPVEVVRYLPAPPAGYAHVVIGGNIALVNSKTFFVMDVFHFEM
jgi:Ni/Co efflux regulator RcnB